jgi:hypothetical protein
LSLPLSLPTLPPFFGINFAKPLFPLPIQFGNLPTYLPPSLPPSCFTP